MLDVIALVLAVLHALVDLFGAVVPQDVRCACCAARIVVVDDET